MGLYLGKEKINNLSVGQAALGITDISNETTINISGILKGENNKIVSATPGVDYVVPGDSTVTSVNGQTGAVTVHEVPAVTATDDGKFLRVVSGAWEAASSASQYVQPDEPIDAPEFSLWVDTDEEALYIARAEGVGF